MKRPSYAEVQAALAQLVHELIQWDFVAQMDERDEYGKSTALGYAQDVLEAIAKSHAR